MTSSTRAILTSLLTHDTSLAPAEQTALRSALGECHGATMTALPSSPALLLTQRQAADVLGTHRTTVWRLTGMGILRPVEISPGTKKFERSQVETLAKEGYRHLLKPARLPKAA